MAEAPARPAVCAGPSDHAQPLPGLAEAAGARGTRFPAPARPALRLARAQLDPAFLSLHRNRCYRVSHREYLSPFFVQLHLRRLSFR